MDIDKVNETAAKVKQVGNSMMAIGCLLTICSVVFVVILVMFL